MLSISLLNIWTLFPKLSNYLFNWNAWSLRLLNSPLLLWFISFYYAISPSWNTISLRIFKFAICSQEHNYLSSAYSLVARAISLSTKLIFWSRLNYSASIYKLSFFNWSNSLMKMSVCYLSSLIRCKHSFSKCYLSTWRCLY